MTPYQTQRFKSLSHRASIVVENLTSLHFIRPLTHKTVVEFAIDEIQAWLSSQWYDDGLVPTKVDLTPKQKSNLEYILKQLEQLQAEIILGIEPKEDTYDTN